MRNTIDDVKMYLMENTKIKLLSTEYKNRNQILKFKCECGEIFETTMGSLKSSKNKTHCNKCSLAKVSARFSKTNDIFKKEIKDILGCEYTLLSEYKNTKTKVKIAHKCGFLWNVRPDAITSARQKCPRCFNTIKKTTSEFKREVFLLLKGEFEVIGEYKNTHTKIEIKHNECGRTWTQQLANFLNYKSCPLCVKERKSKGEQAIERFLNNSKKNFVAEFRINECRNKRPLPFDFAVFNSEGDLECLIEFDGIQHFDESRDYWKTLEKTKKNDKIKNNYCENNNIRLIRIPYWNYNTIEQILFENINLIF